jgi:hypothetical protein
VKANPVLGAGDKYDVGAISGHGPGTVPLGPVGAALFAASMDGEVVLQEGGADGNYDDWEVSLLRAFCISYPRFA